MTSLTEQIQTMKNIIEESIRKQWFGELNIGTPTDKGIVDELYFLRFDGFAGACKMYKPEPGKGLLMAQIGKKAYSIGELQIVKP